MTSFKRSPNLRCKIKVCIRVKAAPRRRSKIVRASTACTWPMSSCTGFCAAWWICLHTVGQTWGTSERRGCVRCNDSTKTRSTDGDIPICLSTNWCDLFSNMFTLSVTICPYHEHLCIPRFLNKVLFNGLLVGCHLFFYLCFKEVEWITGMPATKCVRKIMGHEMPRDWGDCEGSICRLVVKVEVLYVLVSAGSLWGKRLSTIFTTKQVHTVSKGPPDKIWDIERAIEGFSATHNTFI